MRDYEVPDWARPRGSCPPQSDDEWVEASLYASEDESEPEPTAYARRAAEAAQVPTRPEGSPPLLPMHAIAALNDRDRLYKVLSALADVQETSELVNRAEPGSPRELALATKLAIQCGELIEAAVATRYAKAARAWARDADLETLIATIEYWAVASEPGEASPSSNSSTRGTARQSTRRSPGRDWL